jgi:hypothetical protein
MPAAQELLGIFVAIVVIWLILKMAKVAIKMILFIVTLLIVVGALYYMFVR